MSMLALILIDRDGTIVVERDHLSSPEELQLLEGAAAGLRMIREMGLPAIMVTNQSAIARGYLDAARLDEIHARLAEMLAAEGTKVDGIYFCPHHPDDRCLCRKPGAEMAYRAAADFHGDLGRSFVIGDKMSDIEMGKQVGARTILVRTGYGAQLAASPASKQADYIAENLLEAAQIIRDVVGRKAAAR